MNFKEIVDWLNENGHLIPRGNTFTNNNVHSSPKKSKRRLEIMDTELNLSISSIKFKSQFQNIKSFSRH